MLSNYNNIDLSTYEFNQPIYNFKKKLFVSQFLSNGKNFRTNSQNFKLISIINSKENINLQVEFMPTSDHFYQLISEIDEHAKNDIIKNGSKWFGEVKKETLENIYRNTIMLPSKIPRLPYMNFIININDEKCSCKIKSKKKLVDVSYLKTNMEIEIKFNIEGIYFNKNI